MARFIELVEGIEFDEDLYRYLVQYFSDSELDSMARAIKRPPSRYYIRVNTIKVDSASLIRILEARGFRAYPDEALEEAVWLPIEGPFRVESSPKYVVADKHASESVYLGANLYGPGVLYMPPGISRGDVVNVVSPRGDVVASGIAMVDSGSFKRGFRGVVVEVKESVYRLPKLRELPEYGFGLFYEQSQPAQWVGRVVEPREGEVIVDMCAAPGGKATHVAQLSGNRAVIHAFDRSWPKVAQVEFNAARLGVRVNAHVADSRYLDVDYPGLVGSVDKVLIDPPCSDMGVRPKLYYRLTMGDVVNYAEYQRQFIKVAYRLLKPGGALVYSTCTIPPMEDEDNVKYAESLGFKAVEVKIPAGLPALDGLSRRFHPHIHDSPGFFIAKLIKPK